MSLLDLAGKRGLVIGIANTNSIAYGCAKAFHAAGAELAITYVNPKADPYVRPLAEKLASPIIVPCDVREPGQLDAVFERVRQQWGRLDFLLHSIAYAPTEASSIARRRGFSWPWMSPAIPLSGWRSSPNP